MITKKDLEQQFNISDVTVNKILKAVGLDTRKREYTEDEINEFFAPAYQAVNAKDPDKKLSYEQVEQWATKKRQGSGGKVAADNADTELYRTLEEGAIDMATATFDQILDRNSDKIAQQFIVSLAKRLTQIDGAAEAWVAKVSERMMSNREIYIEEIDVPNGLGLPGSNQAIETEASEVTEDGSEHE